MGCYQYSLAFYHFYRKCVLRGKTVVKRIKILISGTLPQDDIQHHHKGKAECETDSSDIGVLSL